MIKSEHEKLGDEELDLKIDYPEIKKNKDLRALDGTIKKFVNSISGECYFTSYDRNVHLAEMEALIKNKEKIGQIVNYVINLDKWGEDNDPIYSITNSDIWTQQEKNIMNSLDFKKAYIILQLIEWGVNPFEIKRYLKSNGNDNFNWKKFIEYVMDDEDILYKMSNYGYFAGQRFMKALNIVQAIYLFEPLFKDSKDSSDNLKPFEIGFLLKNSLRFFHDCYGGMYFILNYLNGLETNEQNNKMKNYLLKIPDGYLWMNFLSDVEWHEEAAENIATRKDSQVSLSYLMIDDVKFDFDEKDFELDQDFWTLLSNLNNDPVMISFFMLVAMRKISFT